MLSVEETSGRGKQLAGLVAAGKRSSALSGGSLSTGSLSSPSAAAGVGVVSGSGLAASGLRPRASGVRKARVLVCDDETRLGDLTAGLLQECGFRAGFVPNAVLAMQYLDQHQDTSVLLLDVNLSGTQSTFELLTELAQRPKCPRVVLTSGSAKQDIRAELTHHPLVVGYLEKPYAEEELTATISEAVS